MTKKMCRLCFEKKSRMITIFTTKGVKQNVANAIRMHFPDEVSEEDILPKYICVKCWTKVMDFHKFYEAVNEAKQFYLNNSVKVERPNFVEIDCDAVEFSADIAFVKHELSSDADNDDDNSEQSEHNRSGADTPQYDSSGSDVAESVVEQASKLDGADAFAMVEQAIEIAAKVQKATKSNNKVNEKFDHLITKYMEMHCELCRHPFATLSEVSSHYRSEHQRRAATLKCCQRRIKMPDIRDHIQYHLNPDVFKCTKCGRICTSKRELKSHQQTHFPKQYECDVCQKKFGTKNYVRKHILTSHVIDDQQYECEICNKSFVTKRKLDHHVKCVHERYYQAVCHVCAKVYNSAHSLAQHLLEHSDVKRPRIICQVCGKSFKDARIMRKHVERTHESHQLQCPHCPKISPNRNALSRHIQSVHIYTVHKCHLCVKEFKRAVALTEHVATHTGEYLYNCAYCPKMFRSSSNMYTHYRQFHPVQWDADKMSQS